MRNRAFIFTMDAALALIPLFIILAAVSTISSGESLFLQSHVLGSKRIAQDVLTTMEYSGTMDSQNQTLLNQTLEKLIPSYLNYNYTLENLLSTQKISVSRGDDANATDVVVAKRIGVITSEYRVAVAPNVLSPTVKDVEDDKAVALNAALYALLGMDQIVADETAFDTWKDVGIVTITFGNISTISPQNIGNLVDSLIAQANAQGLTDAVSALSDFESTLDSYGRRSLTYNKDDFLVYDPVSDSNRATSAADVLLAAAQSANYRRGGAYSPLTSIIGSSDSLFRINLTIDVYNPMQIAVRTLSELFYAGNASVELYVFELNATGGVVDNATVNYTVTSRPSFKIDKIKQDGATIEVTVKSISYDISGTGWISASAVYGASVENAAFKQQDKDKKIQFNAQPKQEKMDVFKEYSGSIKDNYNEAERIAKGGDLDKVLELLSFKGNKVDKKVGYVTVSDAEFSSEEFLITLEIWK